jgi:hypothetical protein
MDNCKYCSRTIKLEGGLWVDPAATGDDITWRESCDNNDTFEANHEPGETQPQHLSPEFWAECLEVREFLINTLDGLVLGVGLLEPDNDETDNLEFYLAPNGDYSGAIIYNRELREFTVCESLEPWPDITATVRTLRRPAAQVTAILRGAVELLDNVE